MACCPSVATWMGFVTPAFFMARCRKNTSFGSSSTWRIVFMLSSFLELNPKVAAGAQFRFEADLRAHAFGRLAHDRQADARALVFRGGMNPLEQSENPVVIFGSD